MAGSATASPVGDTSVDEQRFTVAGVYRWAVKTASDTPAAGLKAQHPVPATIADLAQVPAPVITMGLPRQSGAESTIYAIEGTLVAFKPEADQDYHLVIHDAQGNSMIVEIPDPTILTPACQFAAEITAARAAFDAKFPQMKGLKLALAMAAGTPAPEAPGEKLMLTNVNQPVKVTGVGYFDAIHGQTGVAPNGIELHPVLSIEFP